MSRNELAKGPQTYLDDLASFCYVLRWIFVMFPESGCLREDTPDVIVWCDNNNAVAMKNGQFGSASLEIPVQSWFGDSMKRLSKRLEEFFIDREHLHYNKSLEDLNPEEDYQRN
ncbi:hypothetical protein M422DRAFT_273809 [Sphaerobolus stellatus SS14]|uniref:Uncharacterized protein n=1 Tax=Sphaerobolus stellatus (strain SS14) TaxID=990650 RepID=A0A0C9U830_SPHS4|nr:hypothetical protein M422DRAFT_273809 [Sphaerobolus stellatus SS14]